MVSKHDKICKRIGHYLSNNGYDVQLNKEYGPKNRPIGETDVEAYKDRRLLIFEVKTFHSTNNRSKARIQLNRAYDYMLKHYEKPLDNITCVYASGLSNLEKLVNDTIKKENLLNKISYK